MISELFPSKKGRQAEKSFGRKKPVEVSVTFNFLSTSLLRFLVGTAREPQKSSILPPCSFLPTYLLPFYPPFTLLPLPFFLHFSLFPFFPPLIPSSFPFPFFFPTSFPTCSFPHFPSLSFPCQQVNKWLLPGGGGKKKLQCKHTGVDYPMDLWKVLKEH